MGFKLSTQGYRIQKFCGKPTDCKVGLQWAYVLCRTITFHMRDTLAQHELQPAIANPTKALCRWPVSDRVSESPSSKPEVKQIGVCRRSKQLGLDMAPIDESITLKRKQVIASALVKHLSLDPVSLKTSFSSFNFELPVHTLILFVSWCFICVFLIMII